nr:cytochrome oxidase subunit III [Actinomycetota bacterium]
MSDHAKAMSQAMSQAMPQATPHPMEHHLETSTGLDNRKLAIWTFIGSECLFFATLISNYLVNKGKSLVGPFPHE